MERLKNTVDSLFEHGAVPAQVQQEAVHRAALGRASKHIGQRRMLFHPDGTPQLE